MKTSTLVAAAVLAAALFWSRRSEAATSETVDYFSSDDGDPYMPDQPVDNSGNGSSSDYLGAFLYMIQCAETNPRKVDDGSSYHTFYGNSLFGDLSDHPVITGEKVGVPLPAEFCRRAGLNPGCVSTAAGAYQITKPTWDDGRGGGVRQAGAWGPRLPDFSPESQDEAARRILILCGALPYVERGELTAALSRASSRWASLPGSTAGQGGHSFITVAGWFNSALG